MKNSVARTQPKHKPSKYSTVTFVIAPGIPTEELNALEAAWYDDSLLALNYDVYVKQLGFFNDQNKPLITAPSIPTPEVKALKRRIKRAIVDQKKNVIFTNFDVNVQVI